MTTVRKTTQFILSMILLVTLVSCEGKREIVSGLQEKEANEIVVFLAGKGISADKTAESSGGAGADTGATYTIMVPASQATEALSVLSAHGLPRKPSQTLLDLFKKSGLVSSAQEEQIRYQEGLSEQIASTIRRIDGVIDAVVQISYPGSAEGTPKAGQPEQVTASVYVKHQGILDDPNSQLITKIKRLVAASVVGLNFNDVTVVADRARFTDVGLMGQPELPTEEDKEYTLVWSVVIAKESVGRFRSIFITLSIIILILAAFIAWLLWKLFPVVQASGGVGKIFSSVSPLYIDGEPLPKKKEKSEEEEEEEV